MVENTENRLEMVFITKDQKECVFKLFVYQIRVKTSLIIQNSLTNDQNGQTAQKPNSGQKRPKLLKVSFSRSRKGKHWHYQAAKKKCLS